MNDFLMHYGVKGQQWGVRRFQNEDGTLTEEGRKRYLKDADAHSLDLYNHLTNEGRVIVDKQLASGKKLDKALEDSVKETAKAVESTYFANRMLKRAQGFMAGYGTKLLGSIILGKNSHSIMGHVLKGTGKGLMWGNAAGAAIEGLGSIGAKKYISDIKLSDLQVVDDDKKKA